MKAHSGRKIIGTLTKIVGIVIAALLGLLLIAVLISGFISGKGSSTSGWRSEADRATYQGCYDMAMKDLPLPDETADIQTSFGTIRPYRWGNAETDSKLPLLLIPGRTSGMPMWKENLPDLMEARTVYALDVLGGSGMSLQTSPIKTSADQALWIKEMMDGASIQRAHVVGHSFGGRNACQPRELLSPIGRIACFAGADFRHPPNRVENAVENQPGDHPVPA